MSDLSIQKKKREEEEREIRQQRFSFTYLHLG
jgi:hypothetical protein